MMNMITLALAAALPSAIPLSTVDARVAVAGAELAVTLNLPAAPKGRLPALLFFPGSGPATRQDPRVFVETFTNAGFAVLTFDKRGCGASSGSWLTLSLEGMASDGRALFEWLKARPEVDPARIGLVGASQGGWVAPLVAMGRTDVTFVIAITGGGVNPKTIELFDYERRLAHNGVAGADLDAARQTLTAYFGYLSGASPRSEVTTLLASGKGKPWPSALGLSRVLPDESSRDAWSWVASFDPKPSLAGLRAPVLALIGGRDRDPAAEVRIWQDALRENPSPRTEIRVVPGAGHELTLGDSHAARIFNQEALVSMAAWAASIPAPKPK